MKYIIVLLATASLLSACKKEDGDPAPAPVQRLTFNGTFTGTKAGQVWRPKVYSYAEDNTPLKDRFRIGFAIHSQERGGDSMLRQTLQFGNLKYAAYKVDVVDAQWDTTGRAGLGNESEYVQYAAFLADGDVLELPRRVLLSEPHYIEIAAYNETRREVQGDFKLTLVSRYNDDTARYSGAFTAKIQ